MSNPNVEIVRGIYGRWSQGDFESDVGLYDTEMVFIVGAGFAEAGTYLGPEAIAKFMRGFLETWKRFTVEARDFAAAGDSVVVSVLQRGVGEGSGVMTELPYVQVWSFRGPRVIRLEMFRERADALAALGLSD